MSMATDCYPSRSGHQATFIERLDPVVYNSDKGNCPIAYEFIKSYEENGFLVMADVFSDNEIRNFLKEADRMLEDPKIKRRDEIITEPDSGDIRSIFMVHALSPLIGKLASDTRLAGLAEYILNDQVYIHQSRLNYKPGFRGKEFYWHSDFETWHVEDGMPNMRALSMSITLTENYEVNGPLMVMPSSHRDYVVCTGETPTNHFQQSLKRQEYGVPDDETLTELVSRHDIVSTTGKAGSVIIFDCNIMHGSNSNITPYPRSNIFIVYNALSNRIVKPFCQQPPRPEFIASRNKIIPLSPQKYGVKDYA